jgi:hypothetical protein
MAKLLLENDIDFSASLYPITKEMEKMPEIEKTSIIHSTEKNNLLDEAAIPIPDKKAKKTIVKRKYQKKSVVVNNIPCTNREFRLTFKQEIYDDLLLLCNLSCLETGKRLKPFSIVKSLVIDYVATRKVMINKYKEILNTEIL